jgi:hypothetical protein
MRERPKWMDYIRVRERVIIGSGEPADYVIAFGPSNILVPQKTEQRAQARLELVKEWLMVMMERDRATPAASAEGRRRVLGEDAWLDEAVACGGNRDKLRTHLRAFAANLKSQVAAAPADQREQLAFSVEQVKLFLVEAINHQHLSLLDTDRWPDEWIYVNKLTSLLNDALASPCLPRTAGGATGRTESLRAPGKQQGKE